MLNFMSKTWRSSSTPSSTRHRVKVKVKESTRAKCVTYLERAEKLKEYIKAGFNGDSKRILKV
jgi:hypothetical protein